MSVTDVSSALRGWSVVCLRPQEDQAEAAKAIRARGGSPIALPGLCLRAAADADAARTQLRGALDCSAVIFTSPAAVRFAAMLLPLAPVDGREVFTVGAGTARALAAHRVQAVSPAPDAMHSEGLLALPAFRMQHGSFGLVTAPGGRGLLRAALAERGIRVRVAEVYQRLPAAPDDDAIETLRASCTPRAVLVTSGEALAGLLETLAPAPRTQLLDAVAVTGSARLAAMADAAGFRHVTDAASPMLEAMLDSLAHHAVTSAQRTTT